MPDYFFIGGQDKYGLSNYIPFAGLKNAELTYANFMALKLGFQYQVFSKVFVTPFINYLYNNSSYKGFFKSIGNADLKNHQGSDAEGNVYSALYSYGLNLGYKSLIGPIVFNVSRSSSFNIWRFYLSIGYSF